MSRRRSLRRIGVLVLGVNVALAVAKGIVFWWTGSLAVGSEAVNSLADSTYSIVVLAGLYLTTRPADFDHPHGHERIEPFVSLFVAAGILAAGGLVAYRSATTILAGTATVTQSPAAVGVLVIAAVAKFVLFRYCLRIGRSQNSPAVVATALDNRNDVLTASAALVGVLGARAGYPLLDPLAAGVVSIGILLTGVEVIRDNVGYLVGRAPSDELRSEIVGRVLELEDVEGVHDVVAHYVGPQVDVSLHVEVEGKHTLFEAHEIETAVKDTIEAIPEVDDAFVHVDPKELGEWKADEETDRLLESLDDASEESESAAEDGREDGDVEPTS
ncbi:MAG: cation diffusion facilitator family transporter [Halobacteriales archaeon]|jgi:cation diffusion facilitator family transporter